MAQVSQDVSADQYLEIAKKLRNTHKLSEAESHLAKALSEYPEHAELLSEAASVSNELGKKDIAASYMQGALKADPSNTAYHRYLSLYKRYTDPADPHIEQLDKMAEDPNIVGVKKSDCHFALGKAYEDLQSYETSFYHYKRGNDIRSKQLGFSLKQPETYFRCIEESFTREFVESHTLENNYDICPIFVVGMPRSGTSLTEQILASHKDVHGAGELAALTTVFAKHFGLVVSVYQENFSRMDLERIKIGADFYMKVLKNKSSKHSFITDKMPLNFRYIGFIRAMFPHAKIVHVFRDPRDTCLSLYKYRFLNNNLPFVYNEEHLAGYYACYRSMMENWHKAFPGWILDFSYEDLVNKQEEMTRNLLKFCGLEWDENCLNFHETERAVGTASSSQVKEKLHSKGIGYWKNYEPYLPDVIKDIEPYKAV